MRFWRWLTGAVRDVRETRGIVIDEPKCARCWHRITPETEWLLYVPGRIPDHFCEKCATADGPMPQWELDLGLAWIPPGGNWTERYVADITAGRGPRG